MEKRNFHKISRGIQKTSESKTLHSKAGYLYFYNQQFNRKWVCIFTELRQTCISYIVSLTVASKFSVKGTNHYNNFEASQGLSSEIVKKAFREF